MSVVTVVTRILPVTAQSVDTSNLLKPSDLGKPVEVHKCFVVDPRTGTKFLLETTFCLGKTKDLSSLKVPGLNPLTNLECSLNNSDKNFGEEFALSVPKNIPIHKLPKLSGFIKDNELEKPSNKPHIKLHLNLKMIREATKKKHLIRKKEKLVRPLFKYCIDGECLICGIILKESHRSNVMSHMFSHIKLGTYACQTCENKYFPTPEDLYSHSVKHPAKLDYKCNVCDYKSCRKHFLASHYEKKHKNLINRQSNNLITSFVCSICKIKLQSWKSILDHKKNAHFEKESYICLFCSKTFSPVCKFLRYHAHLRFVAKSHKCKYCQKAFMSQSKLQGHQRLHKVKLQHFCEFCGKKFNFRYSLQKHLQLHSQN